MVNAWLLYLLRQMTGALAAGTLLLTVSEILIPGSILPYVNLHLLLVLAAISSFIAPSTGRRSRWTRLGRVISLLPAVLLVLGYLYLVFGSSASGLMLFAAFVMLGIGVIASFSSAGVEKNDEPEPSIEKPIEAEIVRVDIMVEEVIEIDETNVFMR